MTHSRLSRRRALQTGVAVAAAAQLPIASVDANQPTGATTVPVRGMPSHWGDFPDRPWLGADYWAAPMQDWGIRAGRAECFNAAPNRQLHLLTAEMNARPEYLGTSVKIRRADGKPFGKRPGTVGFRIGIRGPLADYRNALLYGKGLNCGFSGDGRLFIGDTVSEAAANLVQVDEVQLKLVGRAEGDGYRLELSLVLFEKLDDSTSIGRTLNSVVRTDIAPESLAGNIALVCNFAAGPEPARARRPKPATPTAADPGVGAFNFSMWSVGGDKVDWHDDRRFGPILFAQYTLSRGTLKLTAQMPPLGIDDSKTVTLTAGDRTAQAEIHPEARTATFRLADWKAEADVPYTLSYSLAKSRGQQPLATTFTGTIRREPIAKPTLTVADISCNTHAAFPNTQYVEHVRKLDPDFLAFVGDQFYESTGGYGVTVEPLDLAILDYLRKWYIHGWTWRELLRDRPSIALPDDHDVYQGNIWGEAGAAQTKSQEAGGYRLPPDWVNVVHRTQTSHHPDAHDLAPLASGITQFYGRLVYAGIDFAILADRMYKSAPEGKAPPTGSRADHVVDPKFDPRTADLPGLELLGPKQEKFLADWADDWTGVEMKAVVSQTIFTAMATTHGGGREVLRADYDANGWPQSARNRAVRLLHKARAFHIAGDQHLPALIQYGIDAARDAGFAFAGPAVNVGYPRWWEPTVPGTNRAADAAENTGDFVDHFGNPLTVMAVVNGAVKPRAGVLESLADKASGLGIVRFDKSRRTVTIECWPLLVDPTAADAKQFPGWPVTVSVATNDK